VLIPHRLGNCSAPEAQLKFTQAGTELTADLTMVKGVNYEWGINGPYPNNKLFTIKQPACSRPSIT
jgi:hypothetical protein